VSGAPLPVPAGGKSARRVVTSWAVYDLGNTIYSAIVMTAFLPPLFEHRYGSLTPFGLTTSLTLFASALVSTRIGSVVDRTGRARPGLDLATNVCTLATAALFFVASAGAAPVLAAYAVSLFAYQAALTFYNALLPVVAPPHRRGFVSGLGTGLGYAGIPLALLIGKAVMASPLGIEGTFLVSAVLMTLGTVPLWLDVKDDPTRARSAGTSPRLVDSLRWVAGEPVLGMLLLANFVCADVANTLIAYATMYFTKFAGLSLDAAVNLLIALAVTAMLGGLVVGRYADRVRPTVLYGGACAALVVGLVLAAVAPHAPISRVVLVVTGGVGVSTIWSVGRQLVIRVAPPDRCGEALGLYGITTKASILGTTVFAVLADRFGYDVAVLVQAATLAVGTWLVFRLGRRLVREGLA